MQISKLPMIAAVVMLASFSSAVCAQNKTNNGSKSKTALNTSQVAQKALLAWGKGESSGDYSKFRAMLSPAFNEFSHPVQPKRGVYSGPEALALMNQLLEQRTQSPNQLEFSNIQSHKFENSYLFQFDSAGKVSGYPYKGWNVIQLTIGKDGKVQGFREYLGDIDPAWFQKR